MGAGWIRVPDLVLVVEEEIDRDRLVVGREDVGGVVAAITFVFALFRGLFLGMDRLLAWEVEHIAADARSG